MGTAGFRYADWKGSFYPEDLRDEDYLSYYSAIFRVVELDFAYYRMPNVRTMKSMVGKTPEGFEFCVKANRAMTHEVPEEPSGVLDVFHQFIEALEPLRDAGKLGCVLFQFPYAFRPEALSRDYLLRVADLMRGIPAVVEFRNAAWVSEDIFGFLREAGLGFCCVDEPRLRGLMPRIAVATSDLGYIRFHGRNSEKWWHHKEAGERYDYLYSNEELREWIPKIKGLDSRTRKTYVLFNNCHRGNAAKNSLMMLELLRPDGGNTP